MSIRLHISLVVSIFISSVALILNYLLIICQILTDPGFILTQLFMTMVVGLL